MSEGEGQSADCGTPVLTPRDPGYAEALNQMEAAEASQRTEGRPCGDCPWVSREQRDKDACADPIMQTQMKMGGWFCCHVNMGTCYGARLMYEKHLRATPTPPGTDEATGGTA